VSNTDDVGAFAITPRAGAFVNHSCNAGYSEEAPGSVYDERFVNRGLQARQQQRWKLLKATQPRLGFRWPDRSASSLAESEPRGSATTSWQPNRWSMLTGSLQVLGQTLQQAGHFAGHPVSRSTPESDHQ
jgi:hypothetical protein